jgi:hypothetical protein
VLFYRVFRVQADWTFVLPPELSAKKLSQLPRKMPPAAPCTEKFDKLAAAFFPASGAALSWEVQTVKWMSNQAALRTPYIAAVEE